MTRTVSITTPAILNQHEGMRLLSGPAAMLKGALESEIEIALIAGPPRGSFAPFFALDRGGGIELADLAVGQILRQHGMRLVAAPTASRSIALASQAARSGRSAFALIPNDELNDAMTALAEVAPLDAGGALVLILEDTPARMPFSYPRMAAQHLNFACIEPADVAQLRDTMEHALRVSKSGRAPSVIVVRDVILRSSDTLPMRPNRVLSSVDAILSRPRRARSARLRSVDAAIGNSPLRAGRRLELNRFRAMPSPGERVSFGFITAGPSEVSLRHITNALGLHGRVPVLQLGLVHPLDESAVGRMLTRCQQVIVLESRPGELEAGILAIAERMRRSGDHAASIWGREIPQLEMRRQERATKAGALDEKGLAPVIGNGVLSDHPSILVRRISHLLHDIRPTAQVEAQLATRTTPWTTITKARDSRVGASGAIAEIKRILTDVDQWLRERAPLEERGLERSTLSIDGAVPAGAAGRVVQVEVWSHRSYQNDGIAALVQVASEVAAAGGARLFIVHEVPSEPIRDLERFTRGAIPAEAADRVDLMTANLADPVALRDIVREATLVDRMTVIIVRDGPPSKYDRVAVEQSLGEIDRLGFEPRQRLVRDAGEICGWGRGESAKDDTDHMTAATPEQDVTWLKNEYSMERVDRTGPKFNLRVRPLMEEIEVIRTRPPAGAWKDQIAGKLQPPAPIHARQSQWRAHLAGFRCEAPGLAASVLCEAGRLMGYHVKSVHDSTPISMDHRAWAQILFTKPSIDHSPLPLASAIPYGEADLLLGLDMLETLRAIGPDPELRVAASDRTYAIANVGSSAHDEWREGDGRAEAIKAAIQTLHEASQSSLRLLEDFAGACRMWFHTDRVADMAMLGAGFQLGLIPVSPEAIESALKSVEGRGYGRSFEVFEFGRRLAVDHQLFQRPKNEQEEDVVRLGRRMVLSLSRGVWGGGARARNFSQLLQQSLQSMPGLAETEAGRQARRDFVMACHRCRIWGGFALAQRFADLLTQLYRSDRADTGRALTRAAVLPLADAMLIRDPLFIAGMATSPEQRRRMRHRMNVKMARGDRIERRYLTRVEVVAFNRRYRADVRTSDWPARTASILRRFVPQRWRGTRRERELRDFVVEYVGRAAAGAASEYDRWQEGMQRLHNQAAEDRLRGMALAEVKMLLGEGFNRPTSHG